MLTPQLDWFFEPQKTQVDLHFTNCDSIHLLLELFQPLHEQFQREYKFGLTKDTIRIEETFILRRPVLLTVEINRQWDQIFLIPGENQQIYFSETATKYKPHFSDRDSEVINSYFDKKAEIVNQRDIRMVYSTIVQTNPLEIAYEEIDRVSWQFDSLLQDAELDSDLPKWFVEYESRNIKYARQMYLLGAPGYQSYHGIDVNKNRNFKPELDLRELNMEDSLAIPTEFYFGALDMYISIVLNDHVIGDDPTEILTNANNSSNWIKNRRIRDIFNALLLNRIERSSIQFPAELKDQILSTISEANRNQVVEDISRNQDLIGNQAPYFYLKNLAGNFVDTEVLKDKITLLNFWSTNCAPCYEQFSSESKLLNELDGIHFQIVKICMGSRERKWKEIVEEYNLSGINLYSNKGWDEKIRKTYNEPVYSQYMLIDQNGLVISDKCPKPSDSKLLDLIRKHI